MWVRYFWTIKMIYSAKGIFIKVVDNFLSFPENFESPSLDICSSSYLQNTNMCSVWNLFCRCALCHNVCRSKWTQNLTSKNFLESLRCLFQLSRRPLPHLRILRSSNTERKLRGSFWILNSFRSKISILMLIHYFAFQWGPSLYTLKINILNSQN